MSYNKTTWQNGDVITADKLNHMEDGIDSQPFIVLVGVYTYDPDEGFVSYHMLTPLADFKQAVADSKTILLNLVDEDSNNETLGTFIYGGKIEWEGTPYYIFARSGFSKYDTQQPMGVYMTYIRISMNGDVQLDNIFLTTSE